MSEGYDMEVANCSCAPRTAIDGTKKTKGESLDLRVDIERRKKYLAREEDFNQDGARDIRESSDSKRERSMETSSKHHKKSKKSKKKRSRSSSSSSSSSSHRGDNDNHHESEPTEEGFSKARLGPQDGASHVDRGRSRGGFTQFRIRGRGWNRGNFQGNNAIQGNSNPLNVQVQPKNEDWDPEYTPKSKKYYLHDDRDGEANSKVLDGRGRGRGGSFTRGRSWFIIRKGPGGLNNNNSSSTNNNSPKWAHDKFQPNGEQGGQEEDDDNTQPDHKQGGNEKGVENT